MEIYTYNDQYYKIDDMMFHSHTFPYIKKQLYIYTHAVKYTRVILIRLILNNTPYDSVTDKLIYKDKPNQYHPRLFLQNETCDRLSSSALNPR